MLKVEAQTLEEAYTKASAELECSITELQFEIVQHPKPGFLGLFKKTAIIIASCKQIPKETEPQAPSKPASHKQKQPKPSKPKPRERQKPRTEKPKAKKSAFDDTQIIDSFYDSDSREDDGTIEEIDEKIRNLFDNICFDLDSIKVTMLDEKTVYINIQGKDAALLIGKEGYRYKALSYMLFNWINAKYGLSTRLEIAEFLVSQEKMIANYIRPVVAQVEKSGRAQTKPLDGILVQIAVKQLREHFPGKYVGIKTNSFDEKYIIINDFKK